MAPVDFEVYVDGLREFDAAIVERVCEDFGRISPDEFQPRFPPLYQLREQSFRAKDHALINKHAGALCMAPLSERFPPLPPEKFEEIKARFREVLDTKKFPK